jgi:hypothetical protein
LESPQEKLRVACLRILALVINYQRHHPKPGVTRWRTKVSLSTYATPHHCHSTTFSPNSMPWASIMCS